MLQPEESCVLPLNVLPSARREPFESSPETDRRGVWHSKLFCLSPKSRQHHATRQEGTGGQFTLGVKETFRLECRLCKWSSGGLETVESTGGEGLNAEPALLVLVGCRDSGGAIRKWRYGNEAVGF